MICSFIVVITGNNNIQLVQSHVVNDLFAKNDAIYYLNSEQTDLKTQIRRKSTHL